MKTKSNRSSGFPKELKEGNAKVTIYRQSNPSRRLNPATRKWESTGKTFFEYVLAYYQGTRVTADKKTGQPKTLPKFVRQKFGDLADAEKEARFVLTKLSNAEGEVLKLTGLDRASYVNAMQKLREWRADVDLGSAVADYVGAVKRLPENVSLKECLNFYLSRHPAGLPVKTVKEVVDELVATKTNMNRSDVYVKDIKSRLGHFAKSFAVPISTVTGAQLQEWLDNLGGAGRTRNNYRRLLTSLFNFAMRRGYLPKDHSEMGAVEKSDDGHGEIEVFTADELQKLFAACRPEMIPYLSVAAFCGLRAAEIQRLDWSEIHLTGPERFVEVKASKAKTASRRTVPISDNCAAWLARHAQASGPVSSFQRSDKQLFLHLAKKAGVPWKHNGLRHSFISYRLAIIKNVHQVSLEAGNSTQMVFAHYRQLVRESEANAWFAITPASKPGEAEIVTMPAAAAAAA